MTEAFDLLPADLRAFGAGAGEGDAGSGAGGAGDSAPGAAEGAAGEAIPHQSAAGAPFAQGGREAAGDAAESNHAAEAAKEPSPSRPAASTAPPVGEIRGSGSDGGPDAPLPLPPGEAARRSRDGEGFAPPDPDPDPEEAYRRAASAYAERRCADWLREAAELSARDPDFDLDALRRDRVFTLLLRGGVPMERAYAAAASETLAKRAAREAQRAYAAHVRARGSRVPEAGLSPAPALALRSDAVEKLSDAEVRGILARLDGRERISFG